MVTWVIFALWFSTRS